jgi:hypothetical protein
MPRFVILRHEMPPGQDRDSHFDFMFEMGSVLRTWSHPEFPTEGKRVRFEALADHRLAYLEYEGPVSGNRGTVKQVEAGDYEIVEETETLLRYRLHGKELSGLLSLQRDGVAAHSWKATFSPE